MNAIKIAFEIVVISSSLVSAIILVYIKWKPEDERAGRRVGKGGSIQKAIDKVGDPLKSDRGYIKWALAFLAISIIFQLLAIIMTT